MHNLKKYLTTLLLVLIIPAVFLGGFLSGKANPESITNVASVKEASTKNTNAKNIDLGTFWKAWGILDSKFAPASSTATAGFLSRQRLRPPTGCGCSPVAPIV